MDARNDIPRLDRLPRTVELRGEGGCARFVYVDERELPGELVFRSTEDWRDVVDAVKTLAVRGAPAIGAAGAAALALWAQEAACRVVPRDSAFARELAEVAELISAARPTAVNLSRAVHGALERAHVALAQGASRGEVAAALHAYVKDLEAADEAANRAIGGLGAELVKPGSSILTHCNAGSLATVFFGTALGVVYAAAAQGKVARVYADETRPVGQGARLTAWELARAGISTTLICDNVVASLMAQRKVDLVIVGADRIARNGDVANKIGTYGVAVLAREHGVPFYVAVPSSTVDASIETGADIPIEQRAAEEVLLDPIEGVEVYNPAFDVTPARLVDAVITERGVFASGDVARACSG